MHDALVFTTNMQQKLILFKKHVLLKPGMLQNSLIKIWYVEYFLLQNIEYLSSQVNFKGNDFFHSGNHLFILRLRSMKVQSV